MENYVALLGIFLLWASVVWLPVTAYRARYLQGQAKAWALSSIFAFFMVFFGYTRAIANGSVMEAFAWSVSWLMPIGIALFVRRSANVPLAGLDKWLGAVVLVGFLPLVGILPGILRSISAAIW